MAWLTYTLLQIEQLLGQLSGIILRILGITNTNIINKISRGKLLTFWFLPPEAIFAELLTITAVTGSPPSKPEMVFPIPCAT